ncbi:MAG: carboxypeptidase regulatory-like domain-containing protein [Candidatus Riflebacteria bacterium]|nr:carboxypeptidase regulatory-like domain-containing protein [Candidatus Riflebacteria bacterium]
MPWRLLAISLFGWLSCSLVGCGGSGVSDGAIQGTVFTAASGTTGLGRAVGVTVQAERTESPAVIRTATTNGYGNYQFTKIPTGTYQLFFYQSGFQTQPYSRQVQVYVEPGNTAQVPDVYLSPGISTGSAIVLLQVVDAITGEGVSNATVTVGAASSSGGSGGTYTLYVPVTADSSGQPAAQRIVVSEEGHLSGTESPSTVVPIAGQTVSVTVRVHPGQANVSGAVRSTYFDDLYRQNGTYSRVTITSDSIEASFLNASVDGSTGRFTVRVPGSTTTTSRRFNLVFSAQGFYIKTLSNLIAPRVGQTSSLSSDVMLDPATVTLEGFVVTSSGTLPAGTLDQVAVLELGQTVGLASGSFYFPRAPVAIPLTLRATATNPFRPTSPSETGTVRVTPTENGTGRFSVGTITTR